MGDDERIHAQGLLPGPLIHWLLGMIDQELPAERRKIVREQLLTRLAHWRSMAINAEVEVPAKAAYVRVDARSLRRGRTDDRPELPDDDHLVDLYDQVRGDLEYWLARDRSKRPEDLEALARKLNRAYPEVEWKPLELVDLTPSPAAHRVIAARGNRTPETIRGALKRARKRTRIR